MRKRQGKEFCKVFALHFIFYFYFLLFFFIVVVFVIHGHESAIVPFTLISLSFRFSSVAPRLHSEHREITQRFLSIRLFLFPIVHFTYLPFAMPSSFFFFFSWSGRGSTAHCSCHCPAYALEVKNLLRTKLHVVSCGGS